MGSSGGTHSHPVLPSSYHQSISRTTAPPPSTPTLKRPQMEHLSKSNKRSKLNVKEGLNGSMNANTATGSNAGASSSSTSAKKAETSGYTRAMFLTFVDNALKEKRMGKNDTYQELVSQYKAWSGDSTTTTTSTATLKSYTDALTNVVAQLDRSHSTLVEAVTSLPWTTMDEPFVASYMRFVQALLCARSEFVHMTLEKIVKAFRFFQFLGESETPHETTRRQTYDRLHRLLASLIHLIPTLPSTLWPLVNRYLPHKRENRNAQVVYITNALKIVEYCPALGENVLGAVILRAIQIDVEIQCDIEDLEDDEGVLDEAVFGYSVENPFDRLVGDDDESDSDSDDDEEELDLDAISSDEGSDEEEEADLHDEEPVKVLSPKIIKQLKESAAKLDAVLRVIFDVLQRLSDAPTSTSGSGSTTPKRSSSFGAPSGTPSSSSLKIKNEAEEAIQASLAVHNGAILRKTIFGVLLTVFDEKILRTFQTRHTQFILFWYSSLSPDFTDKFSGNLVGRVLDDSNTPTITRVAAAGYLASFVSRSMGIDRAATREVMGLLCTYMQDEMEDLRIAHATYGKRLDAERIVKNAVVFYAVCQAAFYIFCFRWKDLLDENEEEAEELGFMEGVPSAPTRRWMSDLEVLKEAVSSGLNPLKMCSPTVVSQFARMAHKTDFHYCYSIIEQNKRQSRRSTIISDSQMSTPTAELPLSALHPTLSRSASQPSITELNLVQQTLKDAQIDSHFPFDPYKLPLSASYIHGIYRNWDSHLDEDDDDDTETENEGQGHDASMEGIEGSSFDSEASAPLPPPPPPPPTTQPKVIDGSIPLLGLIDPLLLPGEQQNQEDPFSKSFEAMSVSPRRSSWTMAGV